MPYKKVLHHPHATLIMVISASTLTVLVGAALLFFMRDIRTTQDSLIAEHLSTLVPIFNHIDKTAQIVDFDHVKNHIDFLNVKSFLGSEVGSMNLAYPEKWQGPYMESNLTIQEKPYMVLKTRKGFFIIPGEGVRLGNGKVMGKDIVLNEFTDVEKLARDPKGLLFKQKGLAIKLNIGQPLAKDTQRAELLTLIDEN